MFYLINSKKSTYIYEYHFSTFLKGKAKEAEQIAALLRQATNMFRIGYDAKRLFNNFTGLGNYSRTLLKDLSIYHPDNEFFLFTPKVKPNSETQYFQNSPMYNVQMPKRGNGAYWRAFSIKRDLIKHRIELFHGLSNEIPMGLQKAGIPSVVTIHDLIFRHYPNQYSWIDRQIYDYKFRYACENADRIVAISESTKRDIIHFYNINPDKIQVIYQSCHERFVQERSQKTIDGVLKKYNLPEDYLLYVGSIIERKNLLGIVQAMSLLSESERLLLVVVGQGGSYKRKVQAFIQQHGLKDQVLFIQPDFSDLPAIYQQSNLFLYPSYFEGFGIPILEAMLSEVPVITSSVSSLPEAAGPDSWLVDPGSPEAIAEGIRTILSDDARREKMIRNGYTYAQKFNGEDISAQMIDLYEEVIGRDEVEIIM